MSTSASSKSRPSARSRSSSARASSQRWQSGRAYSRTCGEGIEIEVVGEWDRLGEAGGGADHRRVVGAERDRDELHPKAEVVAERLGAFAERGVCRDPATERDRGPFAGASRTLQLGCELADDR